MHRVLLPVRLQLDTATPTLLVEGRLIEKLGRRHALSITLLTVIGSEEREQALRFLQQLRGSFPDAEVVVKLVETTNDPRDVILDEAAKDYDLLIMGAPRHEERSSRVIFSRRVDEIVRAAPCPTAIVHGHSIPPDWSPRRILVPTNGSMESRNAAELAFYMADPAKDAVALLNVIPEEELVAARTQHGDASAAERREIISAGIIDELRELGRSLGVPTDGSVSIAASPEEGILEAAAGGSFDLILMGTGVRPGGKGLFLGPRVERILAAADCPVVVFNT
jgi:nucleotide-binding universal stress UspA family protein